MLLSFEFSNHGSIREKQGISFAASSRKDDGVDLIKTAALPKLEFLPVIVVYGANASGKSNLIKALSKMVNLIKFSHRKGEPGGKISRNAFLLDKNYKNFPTTFEANFVIESVRYNYGFEFTDKIITEEWLYSYPLMTPRKLFERKNGEFTFGRELKGGNRVIEKLTRENSLFLSAAIQNNHEQLTSIGGFFSGIAFETSLSLGSREAAARIENEHKWNIDDKVVAFLNKLGTGISGYRVKEEKLSDDDIEVRKKITNALSKAFKEIDDGFVISAATDEQKEIELKHIGTDGTEVYFPINLESAGTYRLLSSLPKLFDALRDGGIVIIDELDLSLHTKAAEALISLFADKDTNPLGAQMLATTHDTNLLQSEYLRRDQVWFTEKSSSGETVIYPLTDISTRKGDNIERGYLQGRFGAIPL